MTDILDIPVSELISQVQASHEHVMKCFNDHHETVQRVLSHLKRISEHVIRDEAVERVKVEVKDPLDELNKLSFSPNVDMTTRLTTLTDILCLYGQDKISAYFKKLFLKHFFDALHRKDEVDKQQLRDLKLRILKVRDIRWLLQEMEKYPHKFPFHKSDLNVLLSVDASRDNVLLLKRILKKDGTYEEHYDSGALRSQLSFVNGNLHGPYKTWYENGQLETDGKYDNGVLLNKYKVYYTNGQLHVDGAVTGENVQWYESGKLMNKYIKVNDKQEGPYVEYHETSGNVWVKATFKNNRVVGDFEKYHENGKLFVKFHCLDGHLKKDQCYYKIRGKYSQWDQEGNLVKEVTYDDDHVLIGDYTLVASW